MGVVLEFFFFFNGRIIIHFRYQCCLCKLSLHFLFGVPIEHFLLVSTLVAPHKPVLSFTKQGHSMHVLCLNSVSYFPYFALLTDLFFDVFLINFLNIFTSDNL